ncbi:aspartate/glutamate racemase family protein [Merdimmobilis hominis]|uniref:aspartate/glutamate racemase family protein n=1 Tax=Merdimmobilis hominis TaxID=2897707 RepID=UPI0006C80816|nr:amino acid racemase [Merdimmobilis hominis]
MHKSIGILGGMGPMATADLFQKIVALTKADSDNDHIRIYIDNNPQIPDRTTAILKGGKDPVPQMLDALRHLEACGADCIVMPCNTAHYFLDRLQPETKIPFISILESTAKACAAAHPGKTACILATTGTLCTGIYEKALSQEGVAYLLPGDRHREILMDGIYRIKAGERLTDPAPFQGMLEDLQAAGADYFILGCTELPLAVEQLSLSGSFVDPTLELAKAAIRFCGGEIK